MPRMGHITSEETKRKISLSEKGKIVSLKTRMKISENQKGKHISPSTEFKKGDNAGEKHHHWKGGNSRWYKEGYYSPKYLKWRERVFRRDHYTCRGCGKIGCYITAHHIKSFAHFPKLRFITKNGLTLCEECHKLTDNYKGKARR